MVGLLFLHWRSKLVVSLAILGYYLVGYFTLNRIAFGDYHIMPTTVVDEVPIVPWTIVVYYSVFVLATLAIWMHESVAALRRYALSVFFAYTMNYFLFASYPTILHRPAVLDETIWQWAFDWTRAVDTPTTGFPSLHMTNCFVAMISYGRTRTGILLWIWSMCIAASTLTTGQHVFWDLPAGAVVGLIGCWAADRATQPAVVRLS